tara:strand:- start:717 stop:5009 length:4293 start_codon:yes stop_codon:yes gene_type:complete
MLNLSSNFKDGLGKVNTLYVYVNIGDDVFLDRKPPFNTTYKDVALKVSDIKESIDISNRKHKINSITISLDNSAFRNNEKLSDTLDSSAHEGKPVIVRYLNNNCKSVSDGLEIFKGYVRECSISKNKIIFKAEDNSTEKLKNKTIPKNITPTPNKEVEDKNKFKRFPVVYGNNEHSKILFSRENTASLTTILYPDYTVLGGTEIVGFREQESPLKIFTDNTYLDVPKVFKSFPSSWESQDVYKYNNYAGTDQYKIVDNDKIVIQKKISDFGYSNLMGLNIQSRDQFQVDAIRKPSGAIARTSNGMLEFGDESQFGFEYQGPQEGYQTKVSDDGSTISFPDQDLITSEDSEELGYYQSVKFHHLTLRHDRIGSSPDFRCDSGEFWLMNSYLGGANGNGVVDLYQRPFNFLYEIVQLLDYRRDIWDSYPEWMVYDEKEYSYSVTDLYPRNAPFHLKLEHSNFEDMHSSIRWTRPPELGGDNSGAPVGTRFENVPGIRLRSSNPEVPDLKILWDGALDEQLVEEEMIAHYESYEEGFGANYPGLPEPLTNTTNIVLNPVDEFSVTPKPGIMDWLGDGETPTLRKLVYGRRIKEDEAEDSDIPLGTWVYGFLPVTRTRPRSSYFTYSAKDSTGWTQTRAYYGDCYYAYGNPAMYGNTGGYNNGNPLPYFELDYDIPNESYPSVSELKKMHLGELSDGQDFPFPSGFYTPNQGAGFTGLGCFQVGANIDEPGSSDFGPIFGHLDIRHNSNPLTLFQNLATPGSDALTFQAYPPISYDGRKMQAGKIDVTFNSLGGQEIVQGNVYSRLKGNIRVDYFVNHIDSDSGRIDLLVECDAFKRDGVRDNIIRKNNLQDGNIFGPEEIAGVQSGIISDDALQNQDYEIASSATPGPMSFEIGVSEEDPTVFFHNCDAYVFDDDEFGEEDQWRQSPDSVNKASFTYQFGPDISASHINEDSGQINWDISGAPQNQVVRGGFKTEISNLELHQRFVVENASKLDYFANVSGRLDVATNIVDTPEGGDEDEIYLEGYYTGTIAPESQILSEEFMVVRPPDVLRHLIGKELEEAFPGKINIDSVISSRALHNEWRFDFSLSEPTDSLEMIEEISKNSLFLPAIDSQGNFKFINIDNYQSGIVLNAKDVVEYKYKKTSKDDLILKVKINYDYKEGLDDYTRTTNDGLGGLAPENLEEYLETYNVDNIDDFYLDFNSRFIKDSSTAQKLRDFILEWNKNQHNVIECTLPSYKYLNLECGDIVQFDSLIDDTKIFGKDYTQSYEFLGQEILPTFMVESISKNINSVKLRLIQMHRIIYGQSNKQEISPNIDFYAGLEDIVYEAPLGTCTIGDAVELNVTENYCLGISPDAEWEANIEQEIIDDEEQESIVLGDVNFDGIINVLDMVILVDWAIGGGELTPLQFAAADMNADDFVDVLDIVILHNMMTS